MSNNIHGIGSSNDQANNSNNNEGYRPVPMNDNEGNGRMGGFLGGSASSGNPREESFPSFFKNTCCPTFNILSVVFIVAMIDIVIYIITLCFGIQRSPTELLAPTYQTLDTFGMKVPIKIQQGQVWRWITFGLLHANFMHISVNVISQLIIGSIIESSIGHLAVGLLYLLSSIGGGIFSSLINNSPGVGASVAIFGLVGAFFGYMIINWKYLNRVMGSCNLFCLLFFMIMIVLMNVSYGFANPIIDNYGHIGGLIFGFFLVFVLTKPEEEGDGLWFSYKIWFWIALVTLILLYAIMTVSFFTIKKLN